MKYQKIPVTIEAITFDELVAHGIANGANVVNGMPWSFTYAGHPITHENDDCYLIPTLEGTMKMGRGDMLITGVKGEIYPCKREIFEMTYRPVVDDPSEGIVASHPDSVLSFGEKAVGLNFNPSGDPAVYQGKRQAAEFINTADRLRRTCTSAEVKRMTSLAITAAQEAQMWLTKAQTWKD